VAVFPLLLLFVTVLGFILGHSREAEETVSRSVLAEFPILGDQLVRSLEPLRGSGLALAVGLGGLAWGGLGVTQTIQHAMAEIWNVPGVRRSNFVSRMGRGMALLVLGGAGLIATSALAATSAFDGELTLLGVAAAAGTVVLNIALLLGVFRMTTVPPVATGQLLIGAVLGGVAWTALQVLGGYLVAHQLQGTSEVYGFFATVLGLMLWIFLGSRVLLYVGEANVVLARHLWPRSIVQPPLTEADRVALADIARQEERRPEEKVHVSFEPEGPEHTPQDDDDPASSSERAAASPAPSP
jgi:uncharacterized BrkB/YihY/UPF0761 family membrane protein